MVEAEDHNSVRTVLIDLRDYLLTQFPDFDPTAINTVGVQTDYTRIPSLGQNHEIAAIVSIRDKLEAEGWGAACLDPLDAELAKLPTVGLGENVLTDHHNAKKDALSRILWCLQHPPAVYYWLTYWRMFHSDIYGTGRGAANGLNHVYCGPGGGGDNNLYALFPDGSLDWVFNLSSFRLTASPIVGDDGVIYIGANNRMYAVNPDGSEKWNYDTSPLGSITGAPGLSPDESRLYFGSFNDKVICLRTSDGAEQWTYDTGADVNAYGCLVGPDGTIYIGGNTDRVYALNPDGSLKWSYLTGGDVRSRPALSFPSKNRLYFGSGDNKLYCLDLNGALQWTYLTGGGISSSPAVGEDGTIYTTSNDGKLYAVKPDGSLKWVYDTGVLTQLLSSPALGPDGTIYFGGDKPLSSLTAVKPDGTVRWLYGPLDKIESSPAVSKSGLILFGIAYMYPNLGPGAYIYCLYPDGTLNWRYLTGAPAPPPPPPTILRGILSSPAIV